MKTFFGFLLFLSLLVPSSHAAAQALYAIQQLPDVTAAAWCQTYEACGRVIAVDVPITIPDASAAPVLFVRSAPPVAEPQYSQLTAWCQQSLLDDPVNSYSFKSNAFSTTLTHAIPPAWGKTRSDDFVAGAMSAASTDLYRYDENAAYAENNPLTVAQACAIATKQAQELFPDAAFSLRQVYTTGRSYYKGSGQTIRAKGFYSMLLAQCFRGIPFAASIHQAFTQFGSGDENTWLAARGVLRASIHDADAWSLNCTLYQEAGTLYEDIPLLPFDTVKARVEALILSGHVRWIDSVTLGYVQYDSPEPDEQLLIPCWVVWCEYHPEGPESERSGGINSAAGLMYDGNSEYYRPLIINAQTGQLIDPESQAQGRCAAPDILTW